MVIVRRKKLQFRDVYFLNNSKIPIQAIFSINIFITDRGKEQQTLDKLRELNTPFRSYSITYIGNT